MWQQCASLASETRWSHFHPSVRAGDGPCEASEAASKADVPFLFGIVRKYYYSPSKCTPVKHFEVENGHCFLQVAQLFQKDEHSGGIDPYSFSCEMKKDQRGSDETEGDVSHFHLCIRGR